MKNIWYRSGDYYKNTNFGSESLLTNAVKFFNIGKTVIVRQIDILHYQDGNTLVYLTPSPFYAEKLCLVFRKFFKEKMHFLLNYELVLISVKNHIDVERVSIEDHILAGRNILFKQGNQFFLYGKSRERQWQWYRKLNADKVKELKFDEKNPIILLSHQVPSAVYEEITLRKGYSPLENGTSEILIKLTASEALTQLVAIFDYYNSQYEITPFPPEIIQEFKSIWSFFHGKFEKSSHRHIISTNYRAHAYVNPNRETSYALIGELNKFKEFSLKAFINGLIEGENPNQCRLGDTPVVTTAILSFPVEVLKWLIHYGADVFCPGRQVALSPIEYALEYQRYEHLDFIITYFSKLRRNPGASKLFRVEKINFIPCSNQVTTTIHFINHQVIVTQLKKSSDLSETEKNNLYALFSANFCSTDQQREEQLKLIFQEDVLEEKLIELIIYQGNSEKLIGFIVYELFLDKDCITVHIVFTAMLPEYRGYAIISLRSLGLVFAVQLLAPPDFTVGAIYIAIDYNSHRLTEDFLYLPKYYSAVWKKFIEKKLVDIFGEKHLHYFQNDTVMSYVEDNVLVRKNDLKPIGRNFKEEFFYQEILGLKQDHKVSDGAEQKSRGAPIYFHASDKNFFRLRDIIFSTLNLDLNQHLLLYAGALQLMMCKLLNIPKRPIGPLSFSNTESLFFNNKIQDVRKFSDNRSVHTSPFYSRL